MEARPVFVIAFHWQEMTVHADDAGSADLGSLQIRHARADDVGDMARLFAVLGYSIQPEVVAERFANFEKRGEQTLVACSSGNPTSLLGLATLHATPVLHRAGAVGRVTALVVDPAVRGRGVGRALMTAAECWASELGCVLLEVTSNVRRHDAHAFYERIGYERTSYRFAKSLEGRGSA
jgi:GNAT superfamily N-acetyltransferase